MRCYFKDCQSPATTKEHIPPKSFFPEDQREQLLTVRSCELHNNSKSHDDTYVLAQICLNASPTNRAREVFQKKILPQLSFNADAFRKTLTKNSTQLPDGVVRYSVDIERCDAFFSALSFGVIFKANQEPIPSHYSIRHIYHNFVDDSASPEQKQLEQHIECIYSGASMQSLNFGCLKFSNSTIYTAKIFGLPNFGSSITLVHTFYGIFKVTSMLTKRSIGYNG